jgi:DNA-binding NarL/FixJ family response regulator
VDREGRLRALQGRSTYACRSLAEIERRVAELIARGRTNREVAAAMFVTQNTVQTHLRYIFQNSA